MYNNPYDLKLFGGFVGFPHIASGPQTNFKKHVLMHFKDYMWFHSNHPGVRGKKLNKK